MAIVDLIMPKMGESITEATIISWQKQLGEKVEAEEPVLDVATDKVDSDVPSPVTGVLLETCAEAGEVVQIGQVLARIETDENQAVASAPESTPDVHQEVQVAESSTVDDKQIASIESRPVQVEQAVSATQKPVSRISHATEDGRFYSPLVRNIARAEGLTQEELDTIPGSGGDGRVTKHDLRNYIAEKRQSETAAMANPMLPPVAAPVRAQKVIRQVPPSPTTIPPIQKTPSASQPAPLKNAGDEILEMDRMRKLIASHMKHSQEVSATVTSFVEADATHLVHWRNRNKTQYQEKYGQKLTFTPLFVEAVISSLSDFPDVNASISGDQIIRKRNINIGIATAMESGNLIVPVIKNAGTLNLQGLTAQLNDITSRARQNKLRADEVQDGTFTISNIGTYGNIMGTPIINQPELAILALGAIKKKPVIQETPHGDIIAIRHMMYLSLAFDHRVIDGFLGGTFLKRIAEYIEAFDPNRSL